VAALPRSRWRTDVSSDASEPSGFIRVAAVSGRSSGRIAWPHLPIQLRAGA
jgi:hypothetical protein